VSAYSQGKYLIKNPAKYTGKKTPTYRSSWEWAFMSFCDNNPAVLHWASESIRIPYKNPLTGKPSIYVPDFFVVYQNKYGKQIAEVVEIKPKKQSLIESKVASARDKLVVAINHAKWASANAYCKSQGLTFRVITENDLFRNGRS
jgi:hypothetical protein